MILEGGKFFRVGLGKILIRDLELFGRHGVLSEEKKGQIFKIDLELTTDFGAAAKSDELKDSVDYREVIDEVAHLVEEKNFQLLETLAEEIASHILSCFPVGRVKVVVKKPQAPLTKPVGWVAAEVDRGRDAKGLS